MATPAKAPWPPSEIVSNGIAEVPLKSWIEYISLVQEQFVDASAWIYRGQANAGWKLHSSLDRHETRYRTTPNPFGGVPTSFDCPPTSRDRHLEAFKEAVRGKRSNDQLDLSDSEWWALAQHHGLATPLLDWAYSPFVALFFAFEEPHACNSEAKAPDRAVFIASSRGIIDNGTKQNPAPQLFSPRREITHRLSSQSGVLMLMPPGTELIESVKARFENETYSKNRHASAVLTKVVIPDEGRIECLKLLNTMNINRMSLFPDLDGAARYINSLWELGFATGLGALPDQIK